MKVIPHPDVTAKVLGDGTLILVSPSGRVFRRNRSAATIWQQFTEGDHDIGSVARSLADGDAALARVTRDVKHLITTLTTTGIVRAAS